MFQKLIRNINSAILIILFRVPTRIAKPQNTINDNNTIYLNI